MERGALLSYEGNTPPPSSLRVIISLEACPAAPTTTQRANGTNTQQGVQLTGAGNQQGGVLKEGRKKGPGESFRQTEAT